MTRGDLKKRLREEIEIERRDREKREEIERREEPW